MQSTRTVFCFDNVSLNGILLAGQKGVCADETEDQLGLTALLIGMLLAAGLFYWIANENTQPAGSTGLVDTPAAQVNPSTAPPMAATPNQAAPPSASISIGDGVATGSTNGGYV